jgi:hypothetical protein
MALILIGWLFSLGCAAGSTAIKNGGSPADAVWWYNHQERIPASAACPDEIDFVLQLPNAWSIDKLDCEDVQFLRKDKTGVVTVHTGRAQFGSPEDDLEFFANYVEERGEAGLYRGGVDASRVTSAYLAPNVHEHALRVEFVPGYATILKDCVASGHLLKTPYPNSGESGRYVFVLVGTVCDSSSQTMREWYGISDSLRFPER